MSDVFRIAAVAPSGLNTPEECFSAVRDALVKLRERAQTLDPRNRDDMRNFKENVAYLKLFYVRAEKLLREQQE